MRAVPRLARTAVERAARAFPAVVLTGPRRAGKTFLLRRLFPEARYVLLEDPDVLLRVRADPQGFLDGLPLPVILDEIQNAPELLSYVRTRIDARPRRTGQWFLTGSHEATLMQGVTESLAGRAAILQLLPLRLAETSKVNLINGGYTEDLARPHARDLWFSSYLQTYLERDVRAITNVRDLGAFRRFIGLVAAHHGQVLNKSDIASPLGVSVPTITEWLHVLEITAQVFIVPPYFENFGKRLIKSPKVYVSDSGFACHLLGIRTTAELERSPFLGAIVEGFAAAEIAKAQVNRGQPRSLYFFRDRPGFEIDFMIPHAGKLWAVEVKSSRTVRPVDGSALASLKARAGREVERWVVHRPTKESSVTTALLPGVKAISIDGFVEMLSG